MLRSTFLSIICGMVLLSVCLGVQARTCFNFGVFGPGIILPPPPPVPAAQFVPGHWEFIGYHTPCRPGYVWVPAHWVYAPMYAPYPAPYPYYYGPPVYSSSFIYLGHCHHRHHC